MRKKRVLVLMHSDLVPPEDTESLSEAEFMEFKTEYDVLWGLEELGHEAMALGLTDDLAPLRKAIAEFKPHIVFNLLEEFHGQPLLDQNVVSYLELIQMPYTGCNPRGLMIARDKALSKKILHYHRIPVPKFAVVNKGRRLKRKPAAMDYPMIVKSQIEEASLGISEASVVNSDDKLSERVAFMHEKIGTNAIIEQYIDGRECYIGVMGNQRLKVFAVLEMRIKNLRADAPKIATRRIKWDYDYRERQGVEVAPIKDLPPEVEQRIKHVSKRAYRILGLSGYARMDFRLDAENRPYFLEANPNPDMSYGGEFADGAEVTGLKYQPLLEQILRVGLANG